MKENIIKIKSFNFALEVISLYKYLTSEKKEYILSKQLLRSGTSIGALVRESEHAESKADFIHKLSIALKEANETDYWLALLFQSQYFTKNEYTINQNNCIELIRLLTSIIKTSKNN
ncbi:MAG: four helix bundle protein [Cyclobacteriaceae bacterium]|nr:four helix bundle protein [Cyclobacteriaceae bacterium]